MMIVVNKQQYLKELARLTLVNILNCPNGIIRRQYENKLKQKNERENKMTIKIKNMQYHRNGICGEPFYVFSFYCNEQKADMIGVVFGKFNRKEIYELDSNPKVAIFKSKLLGENNINFGENSFRGDHYSDYFVNYINEREVA